MSAPQGGIRLQSGSRAQFAPLSDWLGGGATAASLAGGLIAADRKGATPAACLFVPGRVELFGKHTDYAGGRSLLTATDRGMTLVVAPRADGEAHWIDLGRGVETSFDLAAPGARVGEWSNYLRTVARRVAGDFRPFERGVDVAMVSNLPAAAGLSSSSALVVAAFLTFEAANPLGEDPGFRLSVSDLQDLAAYLGAAEGGAPFRETGGGEGVGTFGGSEDHVAIICSRSEHLRQVRFGPVALDREVLMRPGWRLIVAGSGVHADKTGAARGHFNRLAALAAEAAAAWSRAAKRRELHLGAALAAAGDVETLLRGVADGCTGDSSEALTSRVRHFCVESEDLVPAATAAVASGDAEELGRLARSSQELAERDLGNQVKETRGLVRLATECGALAASAFGAGFGGAVWAIVEADAECRFVDAWRRAYTAAFPERQSKSVFFSTDVAGGARWLPPPGSEEERG